MQISEPKNSHGKTGAQNNLRGGKILEKGVLNPLWLSVSEAAKLGGITTKTVRRALQSKDLKYKITANRYLVEVSSLIRFLHTRTKLKNKLNESGIGQYVKEWRN